MADITLDTFTGSNGTSLTAHTGEHGAAWSNHPSYTGAAVLTGNGTVRANQTGFSEFYASGVPADANYSVEGVLDIQSAIGSQFVAICARLSTSSHAAYFLYNFNGDWALQNASGNIATWTAAAADGDRLRVSCNGSAIQGWINNVLRLSGTDSTITAAGRAGLFFSGNATNSTGMHLNSVYARPVTEVSMLVQDGDSQMAGTNTSPTLAITHAMQPAVTDTFESQLVAVGGQTLAQRITAYPTDVAPKYRANADRNVLTIFAGTNDIYFMSLGDGGESLQDPEDIAGIVITRLQSYAALANATGWDTVVCTIPPRDFDGFGGYDPDPYDLSPIIEEVNVWLRANWSDHFDRLADLAADARLDDENDSTYFDADKIHLNATGAAVAGALIAAEINDLGATPAITDITSPTSATIALVGTELAIEWTDVGTIPDVDVLLSLDGGSTYSVTLVSDLANVGHYDWTPLQAHVTATAKIKVRSATDALVFAVSGAFVIATTTPGTASTVRSLLPASSFRPAR